MRQRGFSLLEMVVALSLVASVCLLMGEGLRFAGVSTAKAERRTGDLQDFVTTRRVLSDWLHHLDTPDQTNGGAPLVGDKSRISFFSLAPSFPTGRGHYSIVLELNEQNDGGAELVAYRRDASTTARPAEKVSLIQFKEEAAFSFALKGETAWRDRWLASDPAPDFVRLQSGKTEFVFDVPASLSQGCFTRTGGLVRLSSECAKR
ncbi:MAG: type II secretion system protein [Pseudomonadota bacterium]